MHCELEQRADLAIACCGVTCLRKFPAGSLPRPPEELGGVQERGRCLRVALSNTSTIASLENDALQEIDVAGDVLNITNYEKDDFGSEQNEMAAVEDAENSHLGDEKIKYLVQLQAWWRSWCVRAAISHASNVQRMSPRKRSKGHAALWRCAAHYERAGMPWWRELALKG